jgi:hypothetical protein
VLISTLLVPVTKRTSDPVVRKSSNDNYSRGRRSLRRGRDEQGHNLLNGEKIESLG